MNRLMWSIVFLVMHCLLSCSQPNASNGIKCNQQFCAGSYTGSEFVKGQDVAHQFSNKMAKEVGYKLKELYKKGHYSRVDFEKIEMQTEGMGSGKVVYSIYIPFKRVENKCEAYTSFDHCGGWGHSPDLQKRKQELQKALIPGDKLCISTLIRTKEGLEEYWIQWRNKTVQADCCCKTDSI